MARSGHGSEALTLPATDYEAEDILLVREPGQLRALGDETRARIVVLLREHAASTTELAERLDLPRGTVGHHLKALERAGLVRVVRTRKVRALTEKYYGRVARLFVFEGEESAAAALHARLAPADARRLERRLERLLADFRAADRPDGDTYALAASIQRAADA